MGSPVQETGVEILVQETGVEIPVHETGLVWDTRT